MTETLKIDHTPAESDLIGIADRTKGIQPRLNELKAPIIIEFSGSPKSGKTTNIDIIDHFFRRSGFKVWAPTEGASKRTPYNLRKDLVAFNAWSLNYAVSELLLSYHNVDMPHLVILDRGPFDSLAWMGVLKTRKDLTEQEYGIIRDFALHPKWTNLISRIYLFTCYPKTSLERENELKLTERAGLAMNEEMLAQLLQQYKELADNAAEHPVRTISTDSGFGPKNTSFAIVSDLLDCFTEKLGSAS